jgi:peptide/nickel transport system substrate-binding protein
VIDAPGPWGTGPFTLAEGYSSLYNEIAIMRAEPFACTWLDTRQDRTDKVVLTANTDHWNMKRGPHLERVVFHNDIPPAEALNLVCDTEGEVDIVTEISPADAERVASSEHAEVYAIDAMRVILGIVNRGVEDAPLNDARTRRALNMAVDRDRMVREGFGGYAYPAAGVTPPYAVGGLSSLEPYPHDPDGAKQLLQEAGWPEGRALRLATLADLEGVANLFAEDLRNSLGIEVEVAVIPNEELLAAQHALVEKVMPLPFDVLVFPWIDLTSDAPAAFMHGELYGETGPFRAGPPVEKFEGLMGEFAVENDANRQGELSAEIDRLVYDEALSVFLVYPQALYAVNKHVDFVGFATTFELAETSVTEEHWSRRNGT